MKRWLVFALLFTVTLSGEAGSANKLPPSALKALSAPADVLLYSLDPDDRSGASKRQLHRFKILGQAALNEAQTATAFGALKKAISDWDGFLAMCFNPRQAIRVTANARTYDFVLCYECNQLSVYENDKLLKNLGVTGSPDVLDGLLTSLSLPLAKTRP